ncbi:GNAT family N-acetyltransferase [Massilia genomosp. 1]|uniref:GNAT family N-acetyltransferase n=1 Tax=Massilia genomosp. 1 TaxID=2609280 RepID=A0ABX0MH41_9BURK|nr:GNAT family N-acetyltransferase [Massilia genomosp. 1]NHZ62114.1 GNAT family N-acetyltransferase [Massilia genomosp. 1]
MVAIRAATAADYELLVALDTVASCEPARCAQIRQWIDTGCCYVAQTGESVGAYGVLGYHFFGNGFIEMVMVGEGFRRQGLGMALVRDFQARCTTPKLFASTNLSNQRMQELLKSAGFRTSGLIDNLDDNDPEIVFFSRAGHQ